MIKAISAVAEGGVIGNHGSIPWDLPEDRRVFREITMGGVLIMGRITYESIGRPLPGRDIIVVTSHPGDVMESLKNTTTVHEDVSRAPLYVRPGTVSTAKDVKQAIRMAVDREAYLCGGARIYEEGLKYAEVLYLTKVELMVEGDTYFPVDRIKEFKMIDRERLSANATLLTYVR